MIGTFTRPLIVPIVTGLYSGFCPIAPGTMGTVAALLIFFTSCALFNLQITQLELIQLAVWTFVIGLITVSIYLRTHASKDGNKPADNQTQIAAAGISNGPTPPLDRKIHLDPKEVVIDEWAGIFTALAFVDYRSALSTFVIFGLFRFFDASKIGPVGWFERLPGSFGIMADDIIAGALAGLTFRLVESIQR